MAPSVPRPVPSKLKPITGSVAVPAVIRQAGRQVGVVVLHFDQGQVLAGGALLGVAGGQVIGVQVAGEDFGLDAEQALEMGNPFFEGVQGLVVFHVADVVAEEGVVLVAARQKVFFSSAPTARMGRSGCGRRTGSGA